jgi:hypothetical protein
MATTASFVLANEPYVNTVKPILMWPSNGTMKYGLQSWTQW